jgi:hypothetical protein
VSDVIHVFNADATARPGNDRYPAGQRHALLLFIRQSAESEYDWRDAERVVSEAGWGDIEMRKAGRLDLEPTATDQTLRGAHQDAAVTGRSIVVYEDPIEDT